MLDLPRLLAVFVRHGVAFLLVGGGGAIIHGSRRPTLDLDLLARDGHDNLDRVAAALRELHARLRIGRMTDGEPQSLTVPIDAQFLANNMATTWTTDAGPVDVMLTMPDGDGVRRPYEHYAERSSTVDYVGVILRVAALADIVASKEYADRPKDRDALPELRRLLERGERPERRASLHPNVVRVVAAARDLGLDIDPFHFPDGTKTAADAAAAIGVDVGQIVKSLIFAVDGQVVLAYVSGRNRLDEAKLAAAAGGERCRRIDADAVRTASGFPIGGVPPFGHATELRVYVDPDLLQYDEVWAAAGTWTDVFAIAPDALVRASGGTVTDLRRD